MYFDFSELTTLVPEQETTEIPDLTDDYDYYNDFDIGRPPIGDIGRTIDDFSDDDTDTNCTYDQYECKNGICIATQKICDGEKGTSYVFSEKLEPHHFSRQKINLQII